MQSPEELKAEEEERADPQPTGPFLYGDVISTRLSSVQEASRGRDWALEEAKITEEEAKEFMD